MYTRINLSSVTLTDIFDGARRVFGLLRNSTDGAIKKGLVCRAFSVIGTNFHALSEHQLVAPLLLFAVHTSNSKGCAYS